MKYYTASKSRSQGREFYSIIFRHPVIKDSKGRSGLRIRRGLSTSDIKEADNLVNQMNDLLRNEKLWNLESRPTAEKLYSHIIVNAFYDALELLKDVPFIIAYESGLCKGWNIIYSTDTRLALKKFKKIEPYIYKLCRDYGIIHIAKVDINENIKFRRKEKI